MRKWIVLSVLAILLAAALCGCTQQVGNRVVGGSDVQTFSYAYISIGGEKLAEGYVTQWRDYDQSDVVQVFVNGKYYLTHYSNVVLVADGNAGSIGSADPDWIGLKE